MNTQTEHTRFEERLLAQLQDVIAHNPTPHVVPAGTRFGTRRGRMALAGAGMTAAAGAAAAVMLATGGDGATPAYAVDARADGTVTVEVRDLRDEDGLERKLRAVGIPAVVDYVSDPGTCRAGQGKPEGGTLSSGPADDGGPSLSKRGAAPPGGGASTMSTRVDREGRATFTLDRDAFKRGETLVIAATGGQLNTLGMSITKDPKGLPALPCIPPRAP